MNGTKSIFDEFTPQELAKEMDEAMKQSRAEAVSPAEEMQLAIEADAEAGYFDVDD